MAANWVGPHTRTPMMVLMFLMLFVSCAGASYPESTPERWLSRICAAALIWILFYPYKTAERSTKQ